MKQAVDHEAADSSLEVAAIEAAEAKIALRVAVFEAEDNIVVRPPTPPWSPGSMMPALVMAPDDEEADALGAETLDIADGFRISYNFSPKKNELRKRMSLDGAGIRARPGR